MSERPEFDCVVAGAGAAGLTAALRLAQSGREVLLLEARETFTDGCNTSMSTAMIPAAGTRWQRRHLIEDSPEQFLADVMEKTGGAADPAVAGALTAVSADVVDWLADTCEIPLELVLDFRYPGHSAYRCHTVDDRSGRTLHRRLVKLARADARITFGVPLKLTDVATDGDGAITGAIVASPGGRRRSSRLRQSFSPRTGSAPMPPPFVDISRRSRTASISAATEAGATRSRSGRASAPT